MHIKNAVGLATLHVVALFSPLSAAGQQLATSASWYFYPCSFPNNITPEFGTARDNLVTGIKFGGSLGTGTRVGNPAGIEIRRTFDPTDMTVSTANALWRGVFNPDVPYAAQYGQRVYCPVLVIGNGGKIFLDGMKCRVTCGVALLGSEFSLAGLGYSPSRVGILADPDGQLFADDVIFLDNKESGTNLVDAIIFIGGSIGALVNQPSDYAALDLAIGANGTYMTFSYQFGEGVNAMVGTDTLWLYPQGGIPDYHSVHIEPFVGPNGVLFSVIGPPGVLPMTIVTAGHLTDSWSTATTSAAEGSSVFSYFTGDPADDMRFARLITTNSP